MLSTAIAYSNAVFCAQPNDLQHIHEAGKNIAILERDICNLNRELQSFIDCAIEFTFSGSIEEIESSLTQETELSANSYPLLYADIQWILQQFAATTKAASFRLHITTMSTDMCRKFHTDINDLRLLCTYVGPGTLWLPDEAIDQQALNAGTNELQIEPQHIQQATTGAVVLLKGALYENSNPILHRSPAVEESGEKRFLLRIDTNHFSFE